MEILKFVLIGLGTIIAIVLIVPLFTRKDIRVLRSIVINKPKSEVFKFVKLLRNQDFFSVWAQKDPGMKKEFRGIDGAVGFVSAWESEMKDVGKGEQEIKNIVAEERIDYELRFIKPFEATNQATISFEAVSDGQTKVTWGFSGRMNYPLNLFLLLRDMDGMLGKDLADGLTSLKAILEK